jgi:hypothetical protein
VKNDQRFAIFEAEISGTGTGNLVEAVPAFAVEGGALPADMSDGTRDLSVIEMSLIGTDRTSKGPLLEVGSEVGVVRVLVGMPKDCAVVLKLSLEEHSL